MELRILIQYHVLSAANAGGGGMPQLIGHWDRLHTHFSALFYQLLHLRLREGVGPGKLFHTVVLEHTPKFNDDVGVLAQGGQTNELFDKVQIIFREHADVDHPVADAVVTLGIHRTDGKGLVAVRDYTWSTNPWRNKTVSYILEDKLTTCAYIFQNTHQSKAVYPI